MKFVNCSLCLCLPSVLSVASIADADSIYGRHRQGIFFCTADAVAAKSGVTPATAELLGNLMGTSC